MHWQHCPFDLAQGGAGLSLLLLSRDKALGQKSDKSEQT
ncbi:hypothetical protein EPIB1_1825 [Tritonibacter mobilis]|nr:hypothetical protein EPIB1_1825 [Tritonibacter mobilis]